MSTLKGCQLAAEKSQGKKGRKEGGLNAPIKLGMKRKMFSSSTGSAFTDLTAEPLPFAIDLVFAIALDVKKKVYWQSHDQGIPAVSSSRPVSSLSGRSEPISSNINVERSIQKNTSVSSVLSQQRSKNIVPSISEIIRRNTPQTTPTHSSRLSTADISSNGHSLLREESESEPEPLTAAEEAELLSRSSIDSVAEEIQQSLLKQRFQSIRNPDPSSHTQAYTYASERSSSPTLFKSSRSENYRGSSVYSSSTSTDPDLQQMQAILDRLARREDIPEEWWAAAGLSRTLGRRLGANDDTNDTDSVDGPLRSR